MGSKKKRLRRSKKRRPSKQKNGEPRISKDSRIQYLRIIRKRSRQLKPKVVSEIALPVDNSNVSFRNGNPSIIPDVSITRGSYSLSSERLQILLPTASRRPTRFPNKERNDCERRSSIRQHGLTNSYIHPERRVSFTPDEEHDHDSILLLEENMTEDQRIAVRLTGKIGPETATAPVTQTQTEAALQGPVPLTTPPAGNRPAAVMAKVAAVASKVTKAIAKKKSSPVMRISYTVKPKTGLTSADSVKAVVIAARAATILSKKSPITTKNTATVVEPKAAGKPAGTTLQSAALAIKATVALAQRAPATTATAPSAIGTSLAIGTSRSLPPTMMRATPMVKAPPMAAKIVSSTAKPVPITEISEPVKKTERLSRRRRRIVALYKYYQRQWKRFRQQIPGEANRSVRKHRRKRHRSMKNG